MIIEQIVSGINENIKACLGDHPVITFGLSEPMVENDRNNKQLVYPTIVNNNGEGRYVFLDDRFHFGCYHKLISKSYSKQKGYGDKDIDVEIAEIVMICWGFRDKLQMTALEVEEQVVVPGMPERALLIQTQFDKQTIFNSEFRGIIYNVNPEEFLFSLRYRIMYPFDRNCIKRNCKSKN